MVFPIELAATLSGASRTQLNRWRSTGLLVPEIQAYRPPLYSFRDLVALRAVVFLRAETSLQRVRRAFANLPEMNFSEHPAEYKFATDGRTIVIWTEDGFVDLVNNPGQMNFYSLADIYRPFVARSGKEVPDFERPRRHISVNAGRVGGWPTIEGSRLPYDTVANLVAGGEVSYSMVSRYFPGVSEAAVRDAVDFAEDVLLHKQAG